MKKKFPFARIAAIAVLVVLALCLIVTLILAVIGSPYFMPALLVTLLLPIILWICMFFYKGMKDRSNDT